MTETIDELAKRLLCGHTCKTCWRYSIDCGEPIQNAEANSGCKHWEATWERNDDG